MKKYLQNFSLLLAAFFAVVTGVQAQATPDSIAQCKALATSKQTQLQSLQLQCKTDAYNIRMSCMAKRSECRELKAAKKNAEYSLCMEQYASCQENLNFTKSNCRENISDARADLLAQNQTCRSLEQDYTRSCNQLRTTLRNAQTLVTRDNSDVTRKQQAVAYAQRQVQNVTLRYDNQLARLRQQQDIAIAAQAANCLFGGLDYLMCIERFANTISQLQLKMGDVQKARSNAVASANLKVATAQNNLSLAQQKLAADQATFAAAQNAFNAGQCK